ncbi:hypothetical protein HK097_003037 [Rhizophlyctis rosea]|uniref:Major facilitator superfamily (MFS) profile domain-containing protein n=1 Tax=Rhizophlyctis rosea TaxID=64517 RepID=A0AAD5S593_9FUNG|nr:hypothetical protein HK097_003037 [Rhizophlyctis rosea]
MDYYDQYNNRGYDSRQSQNQPRRYDLNPPSSDTGYDRYGNDRPMQRQPSRNEQYNDTRMQRQPSRNDQYSDTRPLQRQPSRNEPLTRQPSRNEQYPVRGPSRNESRGYDDQYDRRYDDRRSQYSYGERDRGYDNPSYPPHSPHSSRAPSYTYPSQPPSPGYPPAYPPSYPPQKLDEKYGGGKDDPMDDDFFAGELANIIEREKPNPWSKGMLKMYFMLSFAFWASACNGFDGSLFGGLLALDDFKNFYNMAGSSDHATAQITLMKMMYSIGSAVAAVFAGPASDTWGRRVGMGIGSVLIIGGTAMMALTSMYQVFYAGRFLAGFGVTIATTAAPTYVIELAHPLYRGTLGGLYNTIWFVGSILATWTIFGTKDLGNNLSWRVPMWCQVIPSLIMVVGCFIMPESPRWLISVGRTEEARRILIEYHADGNENSQLVTLEFNEMVETIKTDASDKRFWDYSEMFRARNGRWRFLMVFFIAFFGQMSGNNLWTYWQADAIEQAGFNDGSTKLVIMGITPVISLIMAQFGARATDKIGRRTLLITGTFVLSAFTVVAMVGSAIANPNGTQKEQQKEGDAKVIGNFTASIVFIIGMYLFQITYAICWTPMQALYPVECLQTSTRAKGLGLVQLIAYGSIVFNDWWMPLAVRKISWKIYLIFIIWNIFAGGILYFFMVETNGLTLEELDEVFDAPNPRAASVRKRAEIEELEY